MSFAASRVRSLHKAESGHDMLRALGGAGVPIPFRVRALSRGEFHYKFRRVPLQVAGLGRSPSTNLGARPPLCGKGNNLYLYWRARTGGRWQLFRLTKSYSPL